MERREVHYIDGTPSDGSKAITIACFAVMALLLLGGLFYFTAGGRLTTTAISPTSFIDRFVPIPAPSTTGQGDSSGRGVSLNKPAIERSAPTTTGQGAPEEEVVASPPY